MRPLCVIPTKIIRNNNNFQGCLGGSVVFSQKHRHLLNGIERADSIAWNPHKSLGVPLQCSLFLIKENGLLHQCNSSAATYLFQQDKFYDVSYDTGDKSVQCGRKVDVFKFWLMLKARGLTAFEKLIDNAIDQSSYLVEELKRRDGFRLVQEHVDFTNVCFWYIPKKWRGEPETDEWHAQLYRLVAQMKEKMVLSGAIMVGYTPLASKGLGNFFRMVMACFPPATELAINHILDEIEQIGESMWQNWRKRLRFFTNIFLIVFKWRIRSLKNFKVFFYNFIEDICPKKKTFFNTNTKIIIFPEILMTRIQNPFVVISVSFAFCSNIKCSV